MRDKQVLQASEAFIPVFIDTINDTETTKHFGESYGSYPVLRIQDLDGKDIGGRINTNTTAGIVPVKTVLEQLDEGLKEFQSER